MRANEAIHDVEEFLTAAERAARSANGARKAQMLESIRDVRTRLREVKIGLVRLKGATTSTWESRKDDLNAAIVFLEGAIEDAESVFEWD